MLYKIPTILGIVLIFGYFFWDSVHVNTADPTKITLSGSDTLGKDWGAIAAQKEQALAEGVSRSTDISIDQTTANSLLNAKEDPMLKDKQTMVSDPLLKDKNSLNNYSTMESADGREIIVGKEEEDVNEDDKYMSRHEKERRQQQE